MKKLIIVLAVAVVVVSLLPLSSLGASTATVDYSLTRVEPMLGTVTITDDYSRDCYLTASQSSVSFPVDRYINYYPPYWGHSFILTLWFDEANYEGATGFKFYIVTCGSSEENSNIRINVENAVVSVNSLYEDYSTYINEVTVYGENIDFSTLNIVVDCYVGGLNNDGDFGVSFPISKLSVTYDSTTSQGIFLDSINENTTAIYNNLTNAPESFTQAVEDAREKLEEEKQQQDDIQGSFDNMPLPDNEDFDDTNIIFEDMTLDFDNFVGVEDLAGVSMREVWECIWDWGVVQFVLVCSGACLITSKILFG